MDICLVKHLDLYDEKPQKVSVDEVSYTTPINKEIDLDLN